MILATPVVANPVSQGAVESEGEMDPAVGSEQDSEYYADEESRRYPV